MKLTTELHTRDIPNVFNRFVQLIGEKAWRRRVRSCKEEIKGNPFLEGYLRSEYEIAFQLDKLSQIAESYGGAIPIELCNDRSVYRAAAFAAQAVSYIESLPKVDGERFSRRIDGALRNPDDMRGMLLEMAAATHFLRRGLRVSWPELTGQGTFDLLIEGAGKGGLEVECKSISEDKGRKVHRRDFFDFFNLLKKHLPAAILALPKGVCAVLTLPDRLPTAYRERVELAKEIVRTVISSRDRTLADGTSIRINDFDATGLSLESLSDRKVARRDLDRITNTSNQPVACFRTKPGGAFALAVQSFRDDELLDATFATLGSAASDQLSGTRAGLLIARFSGLTSSQLISIGEQDKDVEQKPTALRVKVSKFLSSSSRQHLMGVGFVCAGELNELDSGVVESGGASYHFPNVESLFWSPEFESLFS
ncbi:hypothetical protein [Viridibacterium curvum]|uniref:Uncharacterized protein n=1 Tax=Viridibacterium curvum TaxID=1101404 RepID=A0ABP9R994_9RHOO